MLSKKYSSELLNTAKNIAEVEKGKKVTFSLPESMAVEVEELAKEEQRTVSELLRATFRQYRARRNLNKLAAQARRVVKAKGLTEKDFGGPFAK